MSRDVSEVILPTSVGELRLIRKPKHQRFAEIRRPRFAWSLSWDNALTQAVGQHLKTDLAGAVALSLFKRASYVLRLEPHIALSHDPDDLDQLEDTPMLRDVARVIAHVLRAAIDTEAVAAEARRRIEGDFIVGSPSHLHVGRAVKSDPEKPHRCFGQLEPLGSTTVAAVAPSLGFVPAKMLTDYHGWSFDHPPYSDELELHVEEPAPDILVRPTHRATNLAVEVAATTMDRPAAIRGPTDLPRLHFEAESVTACEALGVAFARGLRLVGEDVDVPVEPIIPLLETGEPWSAFPPEVSGIDEVRARDDLWILCPFGEEEAVHRLSQSRELLYHLLVVWEGRQEGPLNPWDYVNVPPWYAVERHSWSYDRFDLDKEAFRGDLAEAFLASRGEDARASVVGGIARAFGEMRRLLDEVELRVQDANALEIDSSALEGVTGVAERIRETMNDVPPSSALVVPEEPEPPPPPVVGLGTGSAHHSLMPDGTVVENRHARFLYNLEVARKYAEEHGHLRPRKQDRPHGVNLYQWLKNQELRITKGTMPSERRAAVESLPGWAER